MYNVLMTDPLSEHGIQQLIKAEDVNLVKKIGLSEEELLEVIAPFDALLVRSQTQVTAAVLEAGKNLKVVGRAGVGVDNIDVRAATEHGVIVLNAPDGNTVSTSEHTFAMLLALARNIPQAYHSLTGGKWDRKAYVGVELRGKTLGVVGMGRIGTEVSKRAKAFGMTILGFDPYLTKERAKQLGIAKTDLAQLYRESDFITVHTPLIKETRHLIDEQAFAQMKDGVRILNCARGGIVDEQALLAALEAGKVAGAALDVFESEPATPETNPLLAHPRVIVTPHLGASTVEAQENVAIDVSEEVLHVLRGETFKNAVNLPSVPAELQAQIEPYQQLAEKLGSFVVQATNGALEQMTITYAGDLNEFDTSPLTRMILKGALSCYLQDVNYVNAPLLAKARGLDVTEQRSSASRAFTNLITVHIRTSREEHRVAGTLVNGFGARIVKINDYSIDLLPDGHLLYVKHQDRPGAIGRVGTALGNLGINIATMQVGRRDIGGQAIMLLSVDKQVPEDLLATLSDIEGIDSVTEIDLL
ncbi:phosphoglycerate dehydrogenase [Numidum massiliense]|uniref:phosphoglycerate dehydrogenase n=1 Tax=Numidum massiliense TaxID=1522315 RepID=UPI0006D5ADB8|nr:phosphoglycerate dehydrogenase [Numidum massiliense]